MPKIYLVAGEPSGDMLGAALMRSLKAKDSACMFLGLGGGFMESEGLSSLFSIHELSIMGFVNVAMNMRRLLSRMNQTISHILDVKPDILVTIDSPGYSFRLVKALKKRGVSFPCIHYVAPSVWAWKSGRAQKVSQFLDHLMCLFPFEPAYFPALGTSFVGHPVVDIKPGLYPKENLALILPGSREQEIKTHLPLFLEALSMFKKDYAYVLPTLPHLVPLIQSFLTRFPVRLVTTPDEKTEVFSKASFALATNGTIALELAAYHVPMVSAYRVPWITYGLLKMMVRIKHINLVNILLNESIVPENIQCTPQSLLKDIIHVHEDPMAQLQAFLKVREMLRGTDEAADVVLRHVSSNTLADLKT